MSKNFNEITRVQVPAMVHLTKLGWKYIGKISSSSIDKKYDGDTNILIDIFFNQFKKLNCNCKKDPKEILQEIKQDLNNDDLGKSFYMKLKSSYPYILIDFDNMNNNVYHFTAEFTCKNGQDEFRPDITLFINGLPLVFIETKIPNNSEGMISELNRLNKQRMSNKKFRSFLNLTQFMIYSNNCEYDTLGGSKPVQGAFYSTIDRKQVFFNCFREENNTDEEIAPFIKKFNYLEIDNNVEHQILKDMNSLPIYQSEEYKTNLDINTPTNRIITSMCSFERILFLLKYGLVYKNSQYIDQDQTISLDQKHIMRYQQMFAALAVRNKIANGTKSGIIWHTQGSGKIELSYYLTNILKDDFAKKNIITKFYFIVDRLDLLEQAKDEFESRGLVVKTAETREELMKQFKTQQSLEGNSGKDEIIVVNIQKFKEDHEKIDLPNYNVSLQRIFIIDEAHRGYKPNGSFLANLLEADKESIKIALTGTPLLKQERESWKIFGNYIHTYYYDKSILDGYTLKIIREDIETSYKEKMSEIYNRLEKLVQKKDIKKEFIIEHEEYINQLLEFIINDFNKFRRNNDYDQNNKLAAMIVCETNNQARKINQLFNAVQNKLNNNNDSYFKSNLVAKLILHDEGDKETRNKIIQTDFKKNMIVDILIVNNMLLTGFDCPRLKRIYLGRKLQDHSLLQALTRVNRPYKQNKYGYIVDFVNIKANFNQINQAYLNELNKFTQSSLELGQKSDISSQILVDQETIEKEINKASDLLSYYSTNNKELFDQEISKINIDKKDRLLELKNSLLSIRDFYNSVRSFGSIQDKQLFPKQLILNLSDYMNIVQRQINALNQKLFFSQQDDIKRAINETLYDIKFEFSKKAEEELKIVSGDENDSLNKLWNKVIYSFNTCIDKKDPKYLTLEEAFKQRFKENGFKINSKQDYDDKMFYLTQTLDKIYELNNENIYISKKFNDDYKFARVYKRVLEKEKDIDENKLLILLKNTKESIDNEISNRKAITKNTDYFDRTLRSCISQHSEDLNFTRNQKKILYRC